MDNRWIPAFSPPVEKEELYVFCKHLWPEKHFQEIVISETHRKLSLRGWESLVSCNLKTEEGEGWELDVRYAYGRECLKQRFIDHGWDETTLTEKRTSRSNIRHKAILYLCEPRLNVSEIGWRQIPESLHLSSYWNSIQHQYLSLPLEHPLLTHFAHSKEPQKPQKTLGDFATTQLLTLTRPLLQQERKASWEDVLFFPENDQRKEGGLRQKGWFKCGRENLPLITVITVVLNNGRYLEQAIQSVINQSYSNIEYIVIDGGSTDESIPIIQHYERHLDYWISEPDNGIYDAMNKGIQCATGDYLYFVNADDLCFSPETIEAVMKIGRGCSIIAGTTIISKNDAARLWIPAPSLAWYQHFAHICHSTGLVYKRSLHLKWGLYDFHTYPVSADAAFFYRLLKGRGESYKRISVILGIFRNIGLTSSNISTYKTLWEECKLRGFSGESTLVALTLFTVKVIKNVLIQIISPLSGDR
ncbi:glycosyltransferase family 2 protein [Deltaproteobacteria bacterium TL4]